MGGRGSSSSQGQKTWETVRTGTNKSYQRREVRNFSDNNGTKYTIYQLTNNQNELVIRETNSSGAKTIRGRRNILEELRKRYKGTGTFM